MNCTHCQKPYTPNRRWQKFCSTKCRVDYNRKQHLPGVIKSVRQVKRGWSVTLHFSHQPAVHVGQPASINTRAKKPD